MVRAPLMKMKMKTKTKSKPMPSRRLVLVATLGLVLVAGLRAGSPGPSRTLQEEPRRLPLAESTWTRNGETSEGAERSGDVEPRVRLPVDGTGVRWQTRFHTDAPGTVRLTLGWEPGPDGLLVEILLDGERQPPLLDGWRPTRRMSETDLGPRWLGAGEHLLEFIAREDVSDGAIVLRWMQLGDPDA
jgi:hypothetical protein